MSQTYVWMNHPKLHVFKYICVCSICLMISAGKLAILKLMQCFMGCLTLVFAAVEHVNARQFLQLIHKNVRCAGRVMPEYNRGLSRQISVCLQTSSLKITHVDKHVGMAHHWLSQNWMLKVQIPNKHSQTAEPNLGTWKCDGPSPSVLSNICIHQTHPKTEAFMAANLDSRPSV